jgi:AcrR family transcriptional regulator
MDRGSARRRSYTMGARAGAVARTRQRIADCAAERLRGAAEPVTLAGIAAAAGVSRSTVYRHFPAVTSLLDAVAADLLARARFDLLLAAISHPNPVTALTEVTRLGCGIWAIDPPLVRNLTALARTQADAVPVISQLEAGRAQIMDQIARRLGDAGELAAGLSPRDAADLLLAATGFAGWDHLVTARQRPPETATGLIVRLARRAVT